MKRSAISTSLAISVDDPVQPDRPISAARTELNISARPERPRTSPASTVHRSSQIRMGVPACNTKVARVVHLRRRWSQSFAERWERVVQSDGATTTEVIIRIPRRARAREAARVGIRRPHRWGRPSLGEWNVEPIAEEPEPEALEVSHGVLESGVLDGAVDDAGVRGADHGAFPKAAPVRTLRWDVGAARQHLGRLRWHRGQDLRGRDGLLAPAPVADLEFGWHVRPILLIGPRRGGEPVFRERDELAAHFPPDIRERMR